MTTNPRKLMSLIMISLCFIFSVSCAKDTDLFLEAVLEPEEEILPTDEEPTDEEPTDEEPTGEEPTDENKPLGTGEGSDWFPLNPSINEPSDGTTYTPSSQADITDAANTGKTAIISNSFSCTNCTFAADQKIRPAGGVIDGTNIDLNGAYIDDVSQQAFASNVTFASNYQSSWVFPEVFGAIANDNNDDSAAISALMQNVTFARASTNGTYIKNTPTFVSRQGQFIFDLGNGKIEVTSDANYNESIDQQAVFWAFELNVKFFNGEIDLNNIYPAAFRLGLPEAYHFENLRVHSLKNDGVNMRAVAFNIDIANNGTTSWIGGNPFRTYSSPQQFQNGYVRDCIVEDITSVGVGVPNGVAQAFWVKYQDMGTSTAAIIYHTGNIIRRVLGDEAEGIYLNDESFGSGNKDIIHGTQFIMEGDLIYDCTDRAMKATVSNITLNNNEFRPVSLAQGNPAGGAVISIFTLSNTRYPSHYNNNIVLTNNLFIDREASRAQMLNLGDCRNVTVTGNTFSFPDLGNYQGINIGTAASSPANGWVTNATFANNTFINCGYQFLQSITTEGTLTIDSETFVYDMTGTGGASQAVFRSAQASGIIDDLTITNLDIDVDMNGGNVTGFKGLLFSNGASFTNTNWSNIDINYTGGFNNTSSESSEFGYLKGSMNNTNSFTDVLMNGAIGTSSLAILGTEGPILTNARDNNNIPISIQ